MELSQWATNPKIPYLIEVGKSKLDKSGQRWTNFEKIIWTMLDK